MKTIFILLISMTVAFSSSAQNELSTKSRFFFSSGFVTPQFQSGTELMRANQLRQDGLSYYQNSDGSRNSIGSAPNNTGFSLSIGYYLPVPKVKGLGIGLLVNSGQTGSQPSTGGYAEGYFFNFLNFGGGLQYYPFEKVNLYLKAEGGMGSVFTKNRFINGAGEQDFLHHFGIGSEFGGSLGYTFTPFSNKQLGIILEAQYQAYSTRVEVSGLGDDQWRFGALHFSAGIQF